MTTQQIMTLCANCRCRTIHLQYQPTHVMHAILTLATGGFWLLAWIVVAAQCPEPDCTQCASRAKKSWFRAAEAAFAFLGTAALLLLIWYGILSAWTAPSVAGFGY